MKKIMTMLLLLAMALSIWACGMPVDPDGAGVETPDSASHYPVTVTDQAGRQVTIEYEPRRLISSYYITTSLIMALDLEEYLVGVEDNAQLRPIYGRSCPEILDLPNIGTVKELDLESVAALEPDLAILPMKLKNSVEKLEALGIPVLLVEPESQELLLEMIRLVGTATNSTDRAEALAAFLEKQQGYLTGTLSGAPRCRVYLAGNASLLQTAGNAMYQSDLIRLAGGENVAGEIADSYWAAVDYEQLLAWDPEYIILASNAQYTVEDVLTDPNLADCTAVRHNRVFQLPGDAEAWDSPVPGSILGSVWLANVLHPDFLSDTDCAAVMDEYYETFYGFSYTQK